MRSQLGLDLAKKLMLNFENKLDFQISQKHLLNLESVKIS